MDSEKKILISGGVILVVGIASSAANHKPLDKPIVGGLFLILMLAALATFGGTAATLAGDFAMLALLAVLLAQAGVLLRYAP